MAAISLALIATIGLGIMLAERSLRPGTSIEGQILQLEGMRVAAVVARDFVTLERLMAPDCVFIESDGSSRSTAEFIVNLRASETTFETFVVDENRVRVYGGIAVVTGSYHNSIRSGGHVQPVKYARHTRVWMRQEDGDWRMISHQATAVAARDGE